MHNSLNESIVLLTEYLTANVLTCFTLQLELNDSQYPLFPTPPSHQGYKSNGLKGALFISKKLKKKIKMPMKL